MPGIMQCYEVVRTISASVAQASVVIIGASTRRRGLLLYNNGGNSAYITFGPTSAGSSPTAIVGAFSNYAMLGPAIWMGQISAIRNAGSGTFIITELV